jgi:hypothetical protein
MAAEVSGIQPCHDLLFCICVLVAAIYYWWFTEVPRASGSNSGPDFTLAPSRPLTECAPPGLQGGRTVITTIHQPSSKMFLMFDKLLLLADGSTLYYGAASDAMAYFAQRGYTPKYATNPADYLLVRIGPPPGSTDCSLSRRCFVAHRF